MAIIDKAIEEYNGILRWKNRQVAKLRPKSELGLSIQKRALLFGNKKKSRLGPSHMRQPTAPGPGQYLAPADQEADGQEQVPSVGSFKLIGSR